MYLNHFWIKGTTVILWFFVSIFWFLSTKSIFAGISDVKKSIRIRIELIKFTSCRRNHRTDIFVNNYKDWLCFIELKGNLFFNVQILNKMYRPKFKNTISNCLVLLLKLFIILRKTHVFGLDVFSDDTDNLGDAEFIRNEVFEFWNRRDFRSLISFQDHRNFSRVAGAQFSRVSLTFLYKKLNLALVINFYEHL